MLKQNWMNKNKKYAYSGISKIYEYYKGSLPVKKIEKELAGLSTYTRHKEGKRITNYNPFFVYQPNEMWQIDIMYLPVNNASKSPRYQLCVLDVFSRKMFIRIMRKKDAETVVKCFDEIHNEANFTPIKLLLIKVVSLLQKNFKSIVHFSGLN